MISIAYLHLYYTLLATKCQVKFNIKKQHTCTAFDPICSVGLPPFKTPIYFIR